MSASRPSGPLDKIYYEITACMTYAFTFRKALTNRELVKFQNGTFCDLSFTYTLYCVTTGTRNMHIENMYCFIVANNV